MCNFLEYKGARVGCPCLQWRSLAHKSRSDARCPSSADTKVVYRRYASLFFVTGISGGDNELITLEIIHRYVEVCLSSIGGLEAMELQ